MTLHGNHGDEHVVQFSLCNAAGLQKSGRVEFLSSLPSHFLAISETHANAYTQKSFERELREHAVLFGHPVGDRGFAGVAFMYRKSAAWAVRSAPFLHKPCERYYADSRLMCVQLFRVDERRSVIVYVLYGKSGGRWEPEKKKYNAQLLEAVHEDSLCRGDVATIVCGDMNITMEDCPEPLDRYRRDRWVDSAWFGQHGFDCRRTSLKGQGARIDIAILNQTAGALARSYDLSEGVNPNDHCLVHLSLALPSAAQTWYMPRKIGSSQGFQCPPDDYRPPHVATDLVIFSKQTLTAPTGPGAEEQSIFSCKSPCRTLVLNLGLVEVVQVSESLLFSLLKDLRVQILFGAVVLRKRCGKPMS